MDIKFTAKEGSPLDNFLKELRNGNNEAIFLASEEFKKKFPGMSSETFKTHSQLDEFLMQLKQMSPSVAIDFPEEWALLKSFDRGFWLKLNAENAKKIQDKKRLETFVPFGFNPSEPMKCQCIFGNPNITGSFIV